MKHQSIFFLLTRVVIILTATFFFVAQADDKKGGKDPRTEKFRAAEEKIWSAVKVGKLSKDDAQKKLGALKKQIWTDRGKEQKRGGKDPRAEKFRAAEEKIWGAVKAGKLSKEDAQKKLAVLKKEIRSGDQKKDLGDKKEGYDKREVKFLAFEKEILGAVKAGKFSKEAAQKKLAVLKKEIWSGNQKKDSGDKKEGYDKREAKFRAFEKEIWGAVKAGKLSKKEAEKKLVILKKEMFGDYDKKDRDGKKDPDIEALKRQLEALKRENEGLRKRLKKR